MFQNGAFSAYRILSDFIFILFLILFGRYPSLTSVVSLEQTLDPHQLTSQSLLDVTGQAEASGSGSSGATVKRIELTAEFQRLNILLLRAVTGKMIGTALLTEVKVHSTSRPSANNQVRRQRVGAGIFVCLIIRQRLTWLCLRFVRNFE